MIPEVAFAYLWGYEHRDARKKSTVRDVKPLYCHLLCSKPIIREVDIDVGSIADSPARKIGDAIDKYCSSKLPVLEYSVSCDVSCVDRNFDHLCVVSRANCFGSNDRCIVGWLYMGRKWSDRRAIQYRVVESDRLDLVVARRKVRLYRAE